MRKLGVLLVLAAWATAAQAGVIHDLKNDFSFSLPGGYEDFPQGRGAPNLLYSYARGKPGDSSYAVLRMESLGGSISREGVIRETVERAAKESVAGTGITISRFDYRKTRWKSFDLDLVVTSAAHEGRELVILGTQVPLAKDALQINLLGPAADEPRLLADLEELLGSFEGKSNWLTDKERSERMGKAFGTGGGIVIAIVAGMASTIQPGFASQSVS